MWCSNLGNPNSINIWEEPCIPDFYFKKHSGPRPSDPNLVWVPDLCLSNTNIWDRNIVSSFFTEDIVNTILKIKLPEVRTKNKIIWTPEKMAYLLLILLTTSS